MASIIGHTLAAIGIAKLQFNNTPPFKLFLLGSICAFLPDIDVLGFLYGVEYGSFWGHRGITHSFIFAALIGTIIPFIFHSKSSISKLRLFFFYFLCIASHPILDSLTSGGYGVAFFAPLDNTRYFLPWRPIKVSPLGASRFFSRWGLEVLKSELIWIGIPLICILFGKRLYSRNPIEP